MPTLTRGTPLTLFFPLDSVLTVTPASGAAVSMSGLEPTGEAMPQRMLTSVISSSLEAGSTVTLTARVADGAYTSTSPAANGTSSRLAVTSAQAAAVAASADLLLRPSTLAPYALRKWQRAVARVRAGKANAVIACVGDSTTAGQYADGSNAWTNSKALSWPTALADILSDAGIATCLANVTSDNSSLAHSGTVPGFDPRCAFGASWGAGAAAATAGGQMIYSISGALGSGADETFAFTPGVSFDTVEIHWYRSASVGTFTVDCGGVVLTTCASSGATGGTTTPGTVNFVNKTTVTKTAGADPINIIRTATGTVAIVGVVAYLSTTKSVQVLNLGWSGARVSSAFWSGSAADYSPLNTLTDYAADLTIINLGINDAIIGVTQSSFATDYTRIVNAALTTGDVLLCYPTWVDTTIATAFNQAAIYAAITSVATDLSLPVLDLQSRWGSYTIASGLGYIHTDKTHPLQIGYQDMANAIGAVLLTT